MQVAITDCLKIRDGSHGSLLNQLREGRTRQGQLVIPHRLNYQQFSHVTKTLCFQSRADAKTRNQGANTLADTVSLRIKERSRDIQNNNWRFWQTED